MSTVSTGDAPAEPRFDRLLEPPDESAPQAGGAGWRRLLDWSSTSAPTAALLLAGLAVGPHGLSLLSTGTLNLLAPAVPVALAALGVLVGLSVGVGKADEGRMVLPACLHAAITLIVVGAGLAILVQAQGGFAGRPHLVLAAGAALCAASALTLPTGNALEPRRLAVRLGEIEVLVPILIASLLLPWVHAGEPLAALRSVSATAGLVVALGLAVWLLLTVASNGTEERVLALAALLLVGGVSDALSTSALFGGVVAGALWRRAGRRSPEAIGRDVQFVQHVSIVGLLVVAGASAPLSLASLGYGAAYVGCRVVGRLLAARIARRARPDDTDPEPAGDILAPGVFGVALALNAAGVLGTDASVLLGTVVLGTIGSEIVAAGMSTRVQA